MEYVLHEELDDRKGYWWRLHARVALCSCQGEQSQIFSTATGNHAQQHAICYVVLWGEEVYFVHVLVTTKYKRLTL